MAATLSPAADKISFVEPFGGRRQSTASTASYNSENPEDHFEDWTKTTSEKDSWANRERRRSNRFSKIELKPIGAGANRDLRRGSVLGMFQHGVDKDGKPILLSDEDHDEFVTQAPPTITFALPPRDERRLSMSSDNEAKRRGSILSLWKTGKDREGKQTVHSGHEGEDWEVITDTSSVASGPPSPDLKEERKDRRGSVLSIWSQGRDKDGKSVIHSGEEHDEAILEEDGEPLEQVVSATSSNGKEREPRERLGSILSIWTQGRDKDGRSAILSGEEHDGAIEPVLEEVLVVPQQKGQERRGSVLSMWTQGTDKNGRPIMLSGFEEDDE